MRHFTSDARSYRHRLAGSFATSGHKAKELSIQNSGLSTVSWDLKNDMGDKVASGIYVYVVTDAAGDKARGKVAVIK